MSEKMQARDLETMLAQFENGWQELKCLLSQMGPPVSQPYLDNPGLKRQENLEESLNLERPPEADPNLRSKPERERIQPRSIISPLESEEIIRKVENVHRDKEVLERLAKVEKQTRRLTILGAMFSTILVLAMSVFAFLLTQARLSDKLIIPQAAQSITNANPPAPSATLQNAPAQEPEAATPKYVGSVTSNKYHFPDCKWAKSIVSQKLRTFKSVEEAKEADYKPCPACKPPTED